MAYPSPLDDFAHTFVVDGLEPAREYAASVEVDGRAGSVTRRATRRVASLRTSTRAALAPAAPTTGPWVTASG